VFSQFILTVSGAVSDTSSVGTEGGILATVFSLAPLLLMVVLFYFLLIRPQKKKDKDTQKMRSNIQVGDEIVTIGGIIGIVISVRDDTLVIETGSDRSKIRISRWAIQTNNTVHDDVQA